MFGYFTGVKHLHNLIRVYSPNMGAKVGDYYPGDGYVDVVGIDAYTDYIDPGHILGFGEFGPHGPSGAPGTYDLQNSAKGWRRIFRKLCSSWRGTRNQARRTTLRPGNPTTPP